uniref:Uncharacterized protein n=1 Tax=Acrobeloides nanus TaxID=290746 RepID=A0A914D7E6_9BILA
MVDRVLQCYRETRSGRLRSARTLRMTKRVRDQIRHNAERPKTEMARSLEICEEFVRSIVKKDLKMKSYMHSHGQELT